MIEYVDYSGMKVRTVDQEMVYLEDWRKAMGYKSKDQIICEVDDWEAEWDAIEEEFEDWCDENNVIGETC